MGCEKFHKGAGNLFELAIHGRDQRLFVLPKHRAPLFFGFQIDEIFGIEEAGGVGAVVGTADLHDHLSHFGERAR